MYLQIRVRDNGRGEMEFRKREARIGADGLRAERGGDREISGVLLMVQKPRRSRK